MTAYAYDHRNRLTSATDWLVGPYPADDGAGTGWGVHPTSDSTTSLGDPLAGQQYGWWGILPTYATGSTGGGTIGFEATVTSATEGNNVVLTLSATSSVQLEYWAEDASALLNTGDYWVTALGPYTLGTDTVTVNGPTQVTFGTGQNSAYSTTKSFIIRVRAVGDPGSEIILEGDIFNDDALTLNATANPVEEGDTLRLNVSASPGTGDVVQVEWWIEDVSAVWNDDYSTSWTSGGATSGEIYMSGSGGSAGIVDFTTFASPHIFELTESFKIHLRVKNDPNQTNIIILEGRILDRDPMRYEDAGVTYKYDTANQLVTREFDLDGPSGPELASQTYYAYDRGQIVLQFDGNTPADLSHRYTWGPQIDQLLADEAVDSVFAVVTSFGP